MYSTCTLSRERSNPINILVAKGQASNLFGRDWLRQLNVNPPLLVHSLKEEDPLNEILEKNVDVFKPGLGCIKGLRGSLYSYKWILPNIIFLSPDRYLLF